MVQSKKKGVPMIKGILFDIGGVLYIGNTPIKGAQESLEKIKKRFNVRFLTNTTRKTPKMVLENLLNMGFEVEESELFTALKATKEYVKKNNGFVYTILTDAAKEYFKEIESSKPNYVVVGDAYTNFTYENLNKAFRYLLEGATLIAAAKNRYFKDKDSKLSLDAGGFIEALEYASQSKAKIIGKPSREFFLMAVESMQLKPNEVLMVGDDIESDILGAQQAGLKDALVQTGKFSQSDLEKGIKPDFIIEDINELLKII